MFFQDVLGAVVDESMTLDAATDIVADTLAILASKHMSCFLESISCALSLSENDNTSYENPINAA